MRSASTAALVITLVLVRAVSAANLVEYVLLSSPVFGTVSSELSGMQQTSMHAVFPPAIAYIT